MYVVASDPISDRRNVVEYRLTHSKWGAALWVN